MQFIQPALIAGLQLLLSLDAGSVQVAVSPIVAVLESSVVLEDGTVLGYQGDGVWAPCVNIFTEAGVAQGRVVDGGVQTCGASGVVDEQGNFYSVAVCGGPCQSWVLRLNIFTSTARPASRVVDVWNSGPAPWSIVTETGDVYLFNGSAWQYMGNAIGETVGTTRTTWGNLKSRYRE